MRGREINRVVIKIGSSCLTHKNGKLNYTAIDHFLRQIVDLKNQGKDVLLVTSGAVSAGMGELAVDARPVSVSQQQGLAAVGQGLLMTLYNKILREYGEIGAQVLLTASDLNIDKRRNNAYNTMSTLIDYGVIPIINENDTVATDEIKFGDNDTLSARVASLVEADLLIILSDVEGLYNGIPNDENKNLKVINKVERITPDLESLAGGKGSEAGTGGMFTKIEAAKIAVKSGIMMIIGPGYRENIIYQLVKMLGQDQQFYLGTTFVPEKLYYSREEYKNEYKRSGNKTGATGEKGIKKNGCCLY